MRFAAPAPDNKTVINFKNGINKDIITTLENDFPVAVQQTKIFARNFVGETVTQTARNVWNYLKSVTYKKDGEGFQRIKLPSRFIADKGQSDCKSFSLLAASALANLGYKVAFRYASYNNNSTPTHVYCIAKKDGQRIIVDGVWNKFNSEKRYNHKIDHWMQIESLSGIPGGKGFPVKAPQSVNLNDKATLQRLYNHVDKRGLIAKLLLKKMNPTGQSINYSKEQLAIYKKHLEKNLTHFPRATWKGQLIADELTRLNSGTITGAIFGSPEDIAGIGRLRIRPKKLLKKVGKAVKNVAKETGKVAKKAGKIVKKLALGPARQAFLALVGVNAFGLAKRLLRGRNEDRNKYEKFWTKFGGKVSALDKAVSFGKNFVRKKYKKGLKGFGAAEGAAASAASGGANAGKAAAGFNPAWIAAAAPIVIVALKLFAHKKGDTGPGEAIDVAANALAGEGAADIMRQAGLDEDTIKSIQDTTRSVLENGGNPDGIKTDDIEPDGDKDSSFDLSGYLPWILGGGAILYFATRKRA